MEDQEQLNQFPKWWYRNKRPPNDDVYFENLCRVIFQTGLNWQVVEKKWSSIRKAFYNFKVDKVASFTDSDVKRLLSDRGVIRNGYKIKAIIKNARLFQKISKQCGSFQSYLDSLDKSNNYSKVIKEMADTFERIGPTTAALFLFSVGEKINPQRIY